MSLLPLAWGYGGLKMNQVKRMKELKAEIPGSATLLSVWRWTR
jgi:hypothetical protein